MAIHKKLKLLQPLLLHMDIVEGNTYNKVHIRVFTGIYSEDNDKDNDQEKNKLR